MKTRIFLLMVVFSFSTISFNSYSNGKAPEDEKSIDKLYIMGFRSNGTGEELIFTGDDIQSFNLTTREIVFVDSLYIKTRLCRSGWIVSNIYLNDMLLFKRIPFLSSINSGVFNDLVFYFDSFNYFDPDDRLYLNDGFPDLDYFREKKENIQKVREENAEKRKAEWDIFIKYLNDNNKIYTGIEEIKTELPVQIHSAGKTIYVNNRSGKNGVVSVYRIDGVKVVEQTMVNQTSTVEIPVSGFYLVSVKAGNEKLVTKKLIVR